jgi:alkaline phosphatase D
LIGSISLCKEPTLKPMKNTIVKLCLAGMLLPALASNAQLVSPTSGQSANSKKLERSGAKSDSELNFDPALAPFYHGVASGDPKENRVIIWTRRTPDDESESYQLGWQMASDPEFTDVIRQGQIQAEAENDFCAKKDVWQLEPGTTYYYRFYDFATQTLSIVGRTRTAPEGDSDHLRFAVVSCNNYQAGYFNAFRKISERADLDAVIHLGDYIYEYGAGEGTYGYSEDRADRANVPEFETVNLADYRTRYSLYRLDPDLRAAHQQHPFITVWDDHESTNDSHTEGAQNHQEDEGDWEVRKAISRQVYYEWMPIRDFPNPRHYRGLKYGDLAELIMIDTRLTGREPQPLLASDTMQYRTMLGEDQLQWFVRRVKNSTAKWKIIGNQVMFSPFNVGFAASDPTNLDSITLVESIFVDIWDGYPKERRLLLNRLANNPQIDNVVILTGDFHCSFAFDVPKKPVNYPNPLAFNLPTPTSAYDPETGAGSLMVEFATPSVTSANFDENLSPEEALGLQLGINADLPAPPPLGSINYNPHLKYVELINHGYMILDLTDEAAQADWYYVNIFEPNDDTEDYGAGQLTEDGSRHLTPADGEAPEKEDAPELAPSSLPVETENNFAAESVNHMVALNVYPNPLQGGHPLFVHFALNQKSNFQIELLDISGRVIYSQSESDKPSGTFTMTIDTPEDLPAGVYILKMSSADEVVSRKIVVE